MTQALLSEVMIRFGVGRKPCSESTLGADVNEKQRAEDERNLRNVEPGGTFLSAAMKNHGRHPAYRREP